MSEEITTIQISKVTREKLKQFGIAGDSYDTIIRKLMERAKK